MCPTKILSLPVPLEVRSDHLTKFSSRDICGTIGCYIGALADDVSTYLLPKDPVRRIFSNLGLGDYHDRKKKFQKQLMIIKAYA